MEVTRAKPELFDGYSIADIVLSVPMRSPVLLDSYAKCAVLSERLINHRYARILGDTEPLFKLVRGIVHDSREYCFRLAMFEKRLKDKDSADLSYFELFLDDSY